MALVYHGSKTLGACLPLAVSAQTLLEANLGPLLLELQGKLAGLLNVQVALTVQVPTLQATVDAAAAALASLQAALAAGLPSATLQLSATAAILAELELQIGAVNAALAASLEFTALFAKAGIHLYSYTGESGQLGTQLQAATLGGLPGGSSAAPCGAVVLASDVSATLPAMSTAFGVTL